MRFDLDGGRCVLTNGMYLRRVDGMWHADYTPALHPSTSTEGPVALQFRESAYGWARGHYQIYRHWSAEERRL